MKAPTRLWAAGVFENCSHSTGTCCMNTATFVRVDLTWAVHMPDEWPLIFLDSVPFVLCLISEKAYSVHDAETTRVSAISFILGVIQCLCSVLQDVCPFQSRLRTVLELSANSTIAQL